MSKEIHGKEQLNDNPDLFFKDPSPWAKPTKKPADWVLPGTNISKEHKFKPGAYYDDTMVKDTSASSSGGPPPAPAAATDGGDPKTDSERFHQSNNGVYRASYNDAHPARKYMANKPASGAGGLPPRKPKTNVARQPRQGKGPTIDPKTGDFVY